MAGPQDPKNPWGLAPKPAPHGQGPLEWNRASSRKKKSAADSVRSQLAGKGENMFLVTDYKIALYLL